MRSASMSMHAQGNLDVEAGAALEELEEAVYRLVWCHLVRLKEVQGCSKHWCTCRALYEEGDPDGEAEAALEELEEAEAEEREVEEAEDLLEYYLQRAATTQSEAERLLAGARDLEESIGVSLSARRFEVHPRMLAQVQCCLRVLQAACCALLQRACERA